MCVWVKTWTGKHEKGVSLDEWSVKEGGFFHPGGSTVRNYKILHHFWLEEEFVENLLRRFVVKARDWGQPVFSHNKGARCPSVKAAWVTWRMWLASRDLSASWTGSDIRRCHRAVDANFSYLTFSICAAEQTLLVQFTGLRRSGAVTNGGFCCVSELNTNARCERASGRGEFVNKIHKSLRLYALLQLFWLSQALFEGMEQEKATQTILSSWSSNQHNEKYSTSVRRFWTVEAARIIVFCVFPVNSTTNSRSLLLLQEMLGAVSWTSAHDGTSRVLRYFVDTVAVVWCRANQWIFFLLIRANTKPALSTQCWKGPSYAQLWRTYCTGVF